MRRAGKKRLEIRPFRQLSFQSRLIMTGQPADDLVDFIFRPALFYRLFDIKRIDAGERYGIDSMLCHTIYSISVLYYM